MNNIQDEILKDLQSYSTLKENWDGEGANAPNIETIEGCKKFTKKFITNPDFFVQIHSTGRVGLALIETYLYVDIEFFDDYNYSYYIDDNGVTYKGTANLGKEFPIEIKI